MNGKKAKKIRAFCRKHNLLIDDKGVEPNYEMIEHKRNFYVPKDGTMELREALVGVTLINKNKVGYRRAKKLYKQGLLDV